MLHRKECFQTFARLRSKQSFRNVGRMKKNKSPVFIDSCGRGVGAVGNGGNKGDLWDVLGVESFSTGCQEFLRWPSLRFLCFGRKVFSRGVGGCLGQTNWHQQLHRRRLFNFFILAILFNLPLFPHSGHDTK